jgi:hypothetical protein
MRFPSLGIAAGFKEAADSLVASYQSGKRTDGLLYPIAFLYRHSFELLLKAVVELGDELHLQARDKGALITHDLRRLWIEAREIIMRVWPTGGTSYLAPIESILDEFHDLDRSGDGFRYLLDRTGNPNLEKAPETIDLDNLKRVANEAFERLDGCASTMADYLSDMLSNMQ